MFGYRDRRPACRKVDCIRLDRMGMEIPRQKVDRCIAWYRALVLQNHRNRRNSSCSFLRDRRHACRPGVPIWLPDSSAKSSCIVTRPRQIGVYSSSSRFSPHDVGSAIVFAVMSQTRYFRQRAISRHTPPCTQQSFPVGQHSPPGQQSVPSGQQFGNPP
jgi:hypothetical protein